MNSAVRNSEIIENIIVRVFVQRYSLPMLPRLTVYNNVGLTSKASEEIRKILKIAVFDNITVV